MYIKQNQIKPIEVKDFLRVEFYSNSRSRKCSAANLKCSSCR